MRLNNRPGWAEWYEGQAPITRPDRLLEHPHGPQRHEPSQRHRYRIEERRNEVARLRRSGLTQRQIAEQLQVSVGTINGDLQALAARWRREALLDIDAEKRIDVERIEGMFSLLVPKIEKGNIAAIIAASQLLKRKADTLGYEKMPLDSSPNVETTEQLIQQIIDTIGPPLHELLESAPDDADLLELIGEHFSDRPEVRRLLKTAGWIRNGQSTP